MNKIAESWTLSCTEANYLHVSSLSALMSHTAGGDDTAGPPSASAEKMK